MPQKLQETCVIRSKLWFTSAMCSAMGRYLNAKAALQISMHHSLLFSLYFCSPEKRQNDSSAPEPRKTHSSCKAGTAIWTSLWYTQQHIQMHCNGAQLPANILPTLTLHCSPLYFSHSNVEICIGVVIHTYFMMKNMLYFCQMSEGFFRWMKKGSVECSWNRYLDSIVML